MARAHGRFGQMYVGIASSSAAAEPLPNISKWSVSFETDMPEATAFGDTVKVYVAGLPDSAIDFSGFWDAGTAQTYTAAADGSPRRFYLYPSTPSTAGPYWYGTAFFDFSLDAAVADVVAIKGKARGASAITKQGA